MSLSYILTPQTKPSLTLLFPGICSAIFSHLCSVPLGYCLKAHSNIVCWFLFQPSPSSESFKAPSDCSELSPFVAPLPPLSKESLHVSTVVLLCWVCDIRRVLSTVFFGCLWRFLSWDSAIFCSEFSSRSALTEIMSSVRGWDFFPLFDTPPAKFIAFQGKSFIF